jgi:hypothetical protein
LSGFALLKCFTNNKTISERINIRGWTHVLLVNTSCSHLHSFCATGVSSGLATRATLTRVSRSRMGQTIYTVWTCFWFNFCILLRDCFWLSFKWYVFLTKRSAKEPAVLGNT